MKMLAQRRAATATGVTATGTAGQTATAANLLALQRQAGNRAVTSMLQARGGIPVQREISYRPGDLAPHMRALTGTYAKIVWAVRDFHAATDTAQRIALAQAIRGLCDTWLQAHRVPATGGRGRSTLFGVGRTDAQRTIIVRLGAEAAREARKLQADAQYLNRIGTGGFQAMSETTKLNVTGPAKTLAAGGTMPNPYTGADARALELVRKYKLTEAEIAAIRTFTVSDYSYINPAKAGSDAWLMSNVLHSKDEKFQAKFAPRPFTDADPWSRSNLAGLKAEGEAHAAKMLEAVVKLPAWTQVTYRGTRMSRAEFTRKCAPGAQFPFAAFASSAKRREVAQEFADGKGGDVTPPAESTISVVFVVEMKNGRDISALSAAMKPEDEVLILPGSVFVVDDVIPRGKGNDGVPPATAWYTVFLKQTH